MTNKILHGIREAIEGKFERVTFYGIDWASSKDWNAISCPRCVTCHTWRKRAPKKCRYCGLKFLYSAAKLPSVNLAEPAASGIKGEIP